MKFLGIKFWVDFDVIMEELYIYGDKNFINFYLENFVDGLVLIKNMFGN